MLVCSVKWKLIINCREHTFAFDRMSNSLEHEIIVKLWHMGGIAGDRRGPQSLAVVV